jgi:hypothetical protein
MTGKENDLQEQPNLKEIMSDEFKKIRTLSGFNEAFNERWAKQLLGQRQFQETIYNNKFWASVPRNKFEIVDTFYYPVTNGHAVAVHYGYKDSDFNTAAWFGPKFYLVVSVEYYKQDVQVARILRNSVDDSDMYISKPKTVDVQGCSIAEDLYEVLSRPYFSDEEKVIPTKP